jgi:hypothetical protein
MMPPSREACQAYLEAKSATAKLQNLFSEAWEARRKIKEASYALKYGLNRVIKVGDESLANLSSAIYSVSSDISENYIGPASKACKTLLSSIISKIISIILSAPNVLFSLVYIPLHQSRNYSESERTFLLKARSNLDIISRIVSKWSDTPTDNKYYLQMINAKDYINTALDLISEITSSMEAAKEDESITFAFNEDKFNSLQNNLNKAIEITSPSSDSETYENITVNLEKDKNRIYKDLSTPIEQKYKQDRENITNRYLDDMQSKENNTLAAKENLRRVYNVRLTAIDKERRYALLAAQDIALTRATAGGSNYRKALEDTGNSFNFDVVTLSSNLNGFNSNMHKAYDNYKKKQMMCNNVYNSKNMIRYLMNEMLSLIKSKSKSSSKEALPIKEFNDSWTHIGVCYDKFYKLDTGAVDRFEKSDKNISSIEMSLILSQGNYHLKKADSNLDSIIIDNIKKALDNKNMLVSRNNEYEKFLKDIYDIPDWDGSKGVWAVKVSFIPAPYIKAVADSAELVVKVPAYSISGNEKGKSNVNNLLLNVSKSIEKLLNHNNSVNSVLYSYEPYTNTDFYDLLSLLEKSGLMETFANYMTVSSIITGIVEDISARGLSNEWPGYDNCRDAYPDLIPFDADSDIIMAAANDVLSKPAHGITPDQLSKNEDKAQKIPWLIKSLQWFRV